MKTSNKILSIIASLFLLISILLGIIFACSFNHSFYEYEYNKNNQAEVIGMSGEDLMKATDTLLDYLNNERDDIVVHASVNGDVREVFNERETLHMIDVKDLCNNAKIVGICLFISSIVLFGIIYKLENTHFYALVQHGMKYAIFILIVFVSILAIYAVTDFYDFWMNFHYIFFDNDLFILDPNTSIMINMFPESFFFDLVILIMIIYIVSIIAMMWFVNALKKRFDK